MEEEEVIEAERGIVKVRERGEGRQGIGGIHVFRLIGGQRSASPSARTDS